MGGIAGGMMQLTTRKKRLRVVISLTTLVVTLISLFSFERYISADDLIYFPILSMGASSLMYVFITGVYWIMDAKG